MNHINKTEADISKTMQIFRAADAPSLEDAHCMEMVDVSPLQNDYIKILSDEGLASGQEIKVLFNVPGFSLTYVWFKRNFPLPLHTHNVQCLYYIIAGDLKLGTETLGRGDGFFIPEGVPYTYTPGAHGVELLEFRHAMEFDIKFLAKTAPFWEKALVKVRDEKLEWAEAKRPSLVEAS